MLLVFVKKSSTGTPICNQRTKIKTVEVKLISNVEAALFKIVVLTKLTATIRKQNFPAPTAEEINFERRPLSPLRADSAVAVLSKEGRAVGFFLSLEEAARPELALESRTLQTAPGTILLCFTFKVVEREIKRMPIPERAGPTVQHEIVGESKTEDSTMPTPSRQFF